MKWKSKGLLKSYFTDNSFEIKMRNILPNSSRLSASLYNLPDIEILGYVSECTLRLAEVSKEWMHPISPLHLTLTHRIFASGKGYFIFFPFNSLFLFLMIDSLIESIRVGFQGVDYTSLFLFIYFFFFTCSFKRVLSPTIMWYFLYKVYYKNLHLYCIYNKLLLIYVYLMVFKPINKVKLMST